MSVDSTLPTLDDVNTFGSSIKLEAWSEECVLSGWKIKELLEKLIEEDRRNSGT